MRMLIGEANYLVLYRRAVARPNPGDEPGKQGSAVKIRADYLVRLFVGVDQITGKLLPPLDWLVLGIDGIWGRGAERLVGRAKAKVKRRFASRLGDSPGEIDGPGVDAGRGACFQSSQGKTQIPQALGQSVGGEFPRPSRRISSISHNHLSRQRGPRGQNRGPTLIRPASIGLHSQGCSRVPHRL